MFNSIGKAATSGRALIIFSLVCAFAVTSGCGKSAASSGARNPSAAMGDFSTGDDLLVEVILTLNRIDRYVNMELFPSEVVLDASKSINKDTVQATLMPDEKDPKGPANILHVTTDNSQFRTLNVRKNDFVRFPQFNEEKGRRENFDFLVDEVIDDNTLRIIGGPPMAIDSPQRVEVWRVLSQKVEQIRDRLNDWVGRHTPAVGWEPSPDEAALQQLVERLNQAMHARPSPVEWSREPLLSTLPKEMQELPQLKTLDELKFDPYDGRLLQEALWLRDISLGVRPGEYERGTSTEAHGDAAAETAPAKNDAAASSTGGTFDLAWAEKMFDWVVRNIQLETRDTLRGVWQRPWQTLLNSRGTAEDRAWAFILLARQQQLDAVLLAIPDPNDPAAKPRPWAVGVMLPDSDQLYLFDAQLGLPIPGKDGRGVATLAEVAADDGLLRQMDLDAQHPYPVKAADVQKLVALIEASPQYLSRRMKAIEARMSGELRIVLATSPTAVAERLKTSPQIAEVRLWEYPLETIQQQTTMGQKARQAAADEFLPYAWVPELWRGRVLDFKFRRDGDRAAKYYYMDCRKPATEVQAALFPPRSVSNTAKENASLHMGLIAFDEQSAVKPGERNYESAIDYFSQRVLGAYPEGTWARGARYNLARAYEAAGENDKAIATYEQAKKGAPWPQEIGDKLRAKRLKK